MAIISDFDSLLLDMKPRLPYIVERAMALIVEAVEDDPALAAALLPAYREGLDLLERLTNETTIESDPDTGGNDSPDRPSPGG